ncbi:MAG: hypothetical protein GC179_22430 [Anaerolineaceae bacterium]|nr:hypothetical protein [Anaerolineaceae bacterium]
MTSRDTQINAEFNDMRNTNQFALSILVFFIIVTVAIFIGIKLLFLNKKPIKVSFCNIEDSLYKTINAHATEWNDYFFTSSQANMNRFLYFSTEDGEKYTAIKLENPRQFFVVTEYDYPHSYFGASGYIVAPHGIPNSRNEYKYTQLGDVIYCYEKQ